MARTANFSFKTSTMLRISTLAIGVIAGSGVADTLVVAEELPATAKTVEGLTLPDLEIRQDKNRLYFIVPTEKPLPAKIILPRLANVVRSVHWIAEDKATMQVESEPTEWTIDVSTRPENTAAVIVAELDHSASRQVCGDAWQ
jgi:hypothetical protein